MADADLLDIRVPAEFYKALNPWRVTAGLVAEANLTQRMVDALRSFLQDLIRQTLADADLKIRTGRLRNAVISGLNVVGAGTVNSIQGHLIVPPYVSAQEFGATVRPRNGSWLAIPMPDALRPDGTPKRRSPREWRPLGTFVYTAKSGKKFIAMKNLYNGSLTILYALVSEVTLKERLGIRVHYRAMLPILLGMWEGILADEIANSAGSYFDEVGAVIEKML